jgi:hypothetical protein
MSELPIPILAIRKLLFRKAETIHYHLLVQLMDAGTYISRGSECAVIGALEGFEDEVQRMRDLMLILHDHFDFETPEGGTN